MYFRRLETMDGHVALLGGCLNHVYIRAHVLTHKVPHCKSERDYFVS